ncbi:MAG: O-antigen ligase family protein [Nitrospira sp.]|nr:O-antigen ligase family protein [Nitrospira sp.]MCP9442104.1 O-antigen ligase family protein [Nitrospira sp.]
MAKSDAVLIHPLLQAFAVRSAENRWIEIARGSAIVALVGLLYSPTVASVGLIVTYLAFLASGEAYSRLKRVVACPSVYWGLAFLGIVLLGVMYGPASWPERGTDVLKWRTILWFIVLFALFDEEGWKNRLGFAFLVGTGVGLLASCLGTWVGIPLWKSPDALLRNNVTQAMAFSISAMICLWLAVTGRWTGSGRWVALAGAIGFAQNVVFVSHARSGYGVLVIGIGMLALWHARPSQRIAILLIWSVTVVAVFWLSPSMQSRLAVAIDEWTHAEELPTETSMGSRKIFLLHTVAIVAQHPFVGVGTGGFKSAYAEQIAGKYDPNDWRSAVTGDPHNQYLAVLVQHGLPGLLVFLVWLIALATTPAGSYRGLALAILCGWCLSSLFSSHFRTFAEGHLVTTFLGVLLAPHGRAEHEGRSL